MNNSESINILKTIKIFFISSFLFLIFFFLCDNCFLLLSKFINSYFERQKIKSRVRVGKIKGKKWRNRKQRTHSRLSLRIKLE